MTDIAMLCVTDMEKTNSEYEKKSPSTADSRIRRYQVRRLLSINMHICISSHRPLSSDRRHLSYGVCLEVRGEIIRTVLCCIVYDSCAQS